MSQENVDRFVEAVESWNRQDLPGVLRFMDPEIRFEPVVADVSSRAAELATGRRPDASAVSGIVSALIAGGGGQ